MADFDVFLERGGGMEVEDSEEKVHMNVWRGV